MQDVEQCQLLGTSIAKSTGGYAGRLAAKKEIKIEAARNRADSMVFENTSSPVKGCFYKCNDETLTLDPFIRSISA